MSVDGSAPSAAQSLLVVDDDQVLRERLVRAFRDRGFDAAGAADGHEALARARVESPELAVVDLKMPGPSGLEVVRELLAIDPATRVVVLTGYGGIATAIEAIRLGAVHYLGKPTTADEILRALERGNGAPAAAPPMDADAVPSLARVEWEHIQRVLHDCDGNVSLAARLLGVHRRSLQRKLGKLPVRR
ncbi:MAG: response regulator [Myxococcota bacterium]